MKLEGSPRMYKFVVLKLSEDDGGLLAAGLDVVPAAGEYCCCCCCCCYRTNHQRVIAAGFPWDIVHTYIIFINRGGSGVQSLLGGLGGTGNMGTAASPLALPVLHGALSSLHC